MAGFAAAFGAQLFIAVRAFRDSPVAGVLSLVIPGYLVLYALREETRQPKAMAYWAAGIVLIIIGVMLGA